MKRQLVPEITYMRGLCMLGVIGIHVGSYALSNPMANVHLIGLFEILSRFTVPAFFFLSAFGLFYNSPVEEAFSYKEFLQRRIQAVLYPYLAWSGLYLLYNAWVLREVGMFFPQYLWKTLFFGTAMYHLYFMVILLWFYLLMPAWRGAVRYIKKAPVSSMTVLFLVQVAINFWVSYRAGQIHFSQELLQYAFDMRLNYWVLPYVWILLLGGICAEYYEEVINWLESHMGVVTLGFLVSVVAMLGSYQYVIHSWGYTLLEAVFTIHQLSPMGMVYTAMSVFFFFLVFRITPMPDGIRNLWDQLGQASYGVYLSHPFVLIFATRWIDHSGMLYTSIVSIGLYVVALVGAFFIAQGVEGLPKQWRKYLIGR